MKRHSHYPTQFCFESMIFFLMEYHNPNILYRVRLYKDQHIWHVSQDSNFKTYIAEIGHANVVSQDVLCKCFSDLRSDLVNYKQIGQTKTATEHFLRPTGCSSSAHWFVSLLSGGRCTNFDKCNNYRDYLDDRQPLVLVLSVLAFNKPPGSELINESAGDKQSGIGHGNTHF